MRKLLLAVAVAVVCHQTAAAYWPRTDVTREKAQREKLPLAITGKAVGSGHAPGKIRGHPDGSFRTFVSGDDYVADKDGLQLQVPVATPAVRLPLNGNPGGER